MVAISLVSVWFRFVIFLKVASLVQTKSIEIGQTGGRSDRLDCCSDQIGQTGSRVYTLAVLFVYVLLNEPLGLAIGSSYIKPMKMSQCL